jgi:acetoin utilization protein AcuB
MPLIRVGEWMRHPAVTVTPQESLGRAAQLMQQHGLSHLPVVQQGRLVGVVSLAAIQVAYPSLATTLSVYEIHGYMQQLTVNTVMTPAIVTVTPRLPLVTALGLMQDHHLGTVPVVYLGDVIGLLNARDLLPLLGTLRRPALSQRSVSTS